MSDEERRVPIKVKVMDKRKARLEPESVEREPASEAPPAPLGEEASSDESTPPEADVAEPAAVEANESAPEHDYLDDLRRVQAEFDNYRKRTFKERQHAETRGMRQLVEQLLPVLDNFELAIAHGEGGSGVDLVFKELKSTLERAGLSEVPAEGLPFDPQVHEAVESVEDSAAEHPTVTAVYRRGYSFGGDVVRPAMVVVARPPEEQVEAGDAVAEGGG